MIELVKAIKEESSSHNDDLPWKPSLDNNLTMKYGFFIW